MFLTYVHKLAKITIVIIISNSIVSKTIHNMQIY